MINRIEETKRDLPHPSPERATLHHTQQDLEWLFTALQEMFRVPSDVPRVFSADSFFRPRSDILNFESLLEQGENIWISGITLRGLLMNHLMHIQWAANQGKRFRLLLVDPDSTSALDMLATSNPIFGYKADNTKQAILEAIEAFKGLARKSRGGAIEIRLLSSVPFSSMIIVDGNKPNGHMTVEMYGHQIG